MDAPRVVRLQAGAEVPDDAKVKNSALETALPASGRLEHTHSAVQGDLDPQGIWVWVPLHTSLDTHARWQRAAWTVRGKGVVAVPVREEASLARV